jgi:hypothetical protein
VYGLPSDTDLDFLKGSQLIQVSVGENETILRFDPGISIMVASAVHLIEPGRTDANLCDAREVGSRLLPLLGDHIAAAVAIPPGTLRLAWSSGTVLEIIDSWDRFESYTITYGDRVIVV